MREAARRNIAPGRLIGRIARAFREALYPKKCLTCAKFFQPQIRRRRPVGEEASDFDPDPAQGFIHLMRPFLCAACVQTFVPVKPPMCPRCGVMFDSREGEDHLCETCLRGKTLFGIARACGVYQRALMALVHNFKYGEKVRLGRPLSALLFASLLTHWQDRTVDLIVPMPLHEKRLRERGFNPSYLIVRDWPLFSARCGRPSWDVAVDRDLLQRVRPTPPQAGLGRRERMSNVKGAFELSASRAVEGRRVLLVDDVYTTGATAAECARVLLRGGAAEVDVLTLARAL